MKYFIPILCLVAGQFAHQSLAVELNTLFQDNAVLQCDTRVAVWGTGRNGDKTIDLEMGANEKILVNDQFNRQ